MNELLEKLESRLAESENYKKIVAAVYDNPYAERKVIAQATGLSAEDFEMYSAALEEDMIVLTLATTGASNLESRVTRKIMLVNPDIETEIGNYVE